MKSQDAFGAALYDYLHGKTEVCSIEREDKALNQNRLAVYFSEYKDWRKSEKQAMRFVRGRVLDIGCGAGRHTLYVQAKGLDVVGIDSSPLAVKVCHERGARQVHVLPFQQISRQLGTFDTVLMLGNNFGLFGNANGVHKMLERLNNITTAKARIIAQSLDPYATDDRLHLDYHASNRARGRMPGQARLRARYRNLVGPWFDYLLVSLEELRGLVQQTPWHVARVLEADNPVHVAILEKNSLLK